MNSPRQIEISLPILGLAVGTRAMLAAGIALLVAEKLTTERRRSIGWTLTAVGAVTTLPLLWQVFGRGGKTVGDA